MKNIQVGDRVRVVNNEMSSPDDEYFHVGDVGTVIGVLADDYGAELYIQFDKHRKHDGAWYAYFAEVEKL